MRAEGARACIACEKKRRPVWKNGTCVHARGGAHVMRVLVVGYLGAARRPDTAIAMMTRRSTARRTASLLAAAKPATEALMAIARAGSCFVVHSLT